MIFIKLKTLFKLKFSRGFTLIESLVAVSILMVAIVSPMTIAQKGLGSAMFSKDQMTASFLAQDAIEFIKNKRDQIGSRKVYGYATTTFEWIGEMLSAPNDFYNFCVSTNGADKACAIDTIKNGIVYDVETMPLKINRDIDGKFFYYNYDSGTEISKFTREIRIKAPAVSNNNEALITVTVKWQNAGNQESVILNSYIYNYWGGL